MNLPVDPDLSPLGPDGLLGHRLISEAQRRIAGVLTPTPVIRASAAAAWLKLENLQVTGAYKVRGAFNAVAARVERGDRRAVFAASAGNHALGVAWAARFFGLAATVVVPRSAPLTKVGGCRALGAEVVVEDRDFEDCVTFSRALANARGGYFLHPFDDPEVIAGQATVACELLPLHPDVVVIPVGGGGLLAGMGSVLKRAGIRLVGVQISGVDAMRRALSGLAPVAPAATLADGLRVAVPGRLTRQLCANLLDDMLLVEEGAVAAAVASLALTEKVIAEGAGAAAVAALPHVRGQRRVAVVSGGNIDGALLSRLTAEAA